MCFIGDSDKSGIVVVLALLFYSFAVIGGVRLYSKQDISESGC
jgi:hypothetical protein